MKRWREANPERARAYARERARLPHIRRQKQEWSRARRYGVTNEQFQIMMQTQNGACALCQKPFQRTPCIDHDHENGRVRGLLCYGCNIGLGHIEKLWDRRSAISTYLGKPL